MYIGGLNHLIIIINIILNKDQPINLFKSNYYCLSLSFLLQDAISTLQLFSCIMTDKGVMVNNH